MTDAGEHQIKVTYSINEEEGYKSQAYIDDRPSIFGVYHGEDKHTGTPVFLKQGDPWWELTTEYPPAINGLRGTYRARLDDFSNESEKVGVVIGIIEARARACGQDILLHSKLSGGGWTLMWWPANEPRHEVTDQIISKDIPHG